MDTRPSTSETLQQRLESRTATVGVVGLGYVGLPLAMAMSGGGFMTLGFDIDPVKVQRQQITLNHDRGRWFSLGAPGPLPATFQQVNGQWQRLD